MIGLKRVLDREDDLCVLNGFGEIQATVSLNLSISNNLRITTNQYEN